MPDDRIRIATSIPSLKDKVKTNLSGSTDAIYWYIRFNIPLDEETVSEKTMDVTDTEGYIMRSDISYNNHNNMIVISPLDTYEQNRFYLLSISKKVKSARGQNLKSTINILFKLLNNQISDYKVLKQDVKVPKPKPRPSDYDAKQKNRKPSSFDMSYLENTPRDLMKTASFRINIIIGVIGLVLTAVSIVLSNMGMIIAGVLLCLVGMVHIYIQLKDKVLYSTLLFNKGVRQFNKQRYREAEVSFKKALLYNQDNELAQYGLYKVNLYF